MVSDEQGNREFDLIKHKVIFVKFIMTTKEACMELQENISTIKTPWDNVGTPTTQPWTSHIQAFNRMQVSREQKAHKEREQEIQINGQPINNFERQDSVAQVAGAWSAAVSIGDAQGMAAKARGTSTALSSIPTLQVTHTWSLPTMYVQIRLGQMRWPSCPTAHVARTSQTCCPKAIVPTHS